MTVHTKLKELALGTVFCAGPIDARVLEHSRPRYQCSKEHFERRIAPAGVSNIYGRAGHARTHTLGETM